MVCLRNFIREVLDLQPVPPALLIPKQGPSRSMLSKGGKDEDKTGAKQGGGGLGGAIGGGSVGPGFGHEESAHHD